MTSQRNSEAKVPQNGASRNGEDELAPRPFLRWVGGKYHLAGVLAQFAPKDVLKRTYHEPFLGAANLFFALRHPDAYLSDLNGHLIDCYQSIRDNPSEVAKAIRDHAENDSEDYYYAARDTYNRSPKGVARAARFIYLNRTCFNGVFRVNTKGKYNVPYGYKESPRFPTADELTAVATALSGSTLRAQDYQTALGAAKKGHFVYLDPPYPPLNGTSFFAHYTANRFGNEDQEKVAECVRELDGRGSLFLVSNADTPAIRKLYRGFHIHRLSVTRFVSSSRKKHRVGELIITNYAVPKHVASADD